MHELPEQEPNTPLDLLTEFESHLPSLSPSSSQSYRKAIGRLRSFLDARNATLTPSSLPLLADWLVDLSRAGLTFKTASLYLDAISSIYKKVVKEGRATPSPIPGDLRHRLRELGEKRWEESVNRERFDRLQALTRAAVGSKYADTALAADLLLTALIRAVSLPATAMLRTAELDPDDPEIAAIAERQSSSKRKFLFGLGQSKLTPRQLERHTDRLVGELLRSRGIAAWVNSDATLRSYWAFGALQSGIPAGRVRATIGGVPPGLPALAMTPPTEACTADEIRSVATTFLVNPLRWYAMRLRPRVKYDQLTQRLKSLEGVTLPELFYPCEEIAKRTGKTMTFQSRPVIPDVVFFRSRVTDILPLFGKIGDLAWCYTTGGRGSGRYAAIPADSFERFQRTIGQFTDGHEVAGIGELPLRENDRVVVVGGLFQGQEARITKVDGAPEDPNAVYRISFFGDNGIEWRVALDPRIVKKN